ncbi:MAG: hypothetical protein K1X28_01665 [Parachlamydiales bacterium]|nr:hypothetical protein [Parachlamydiales bacterium]
MNAVKPRSYSDSFPSDGEACYGLICKILDDRDLSRAERIKNAEIIFEKAQDDGIWGMGPLGTSFTTYSYSLEVDWKKAASDLISKATKALSPKAQQVAVQVVSVASVAIPNQSE